MCDLHFYVKTKPNEKFMVSITINLLSNYGQSHCAFSFRHTFHLRLTRVKYI